MNIHSSYIDIISRLVRDSIKRWCLYIRLDERSKHNIATHCRFLPDISKENAKEIGFNLIMEGWCLIECDSEQQCYDFYKKIDGEDSKGKIYAAIMGPDGKWVTENT